MWRWNFAFFELFPFAPTCNKKGTWTAFRIKLNVRSHTFAFRLKIFLKGASSTSAERRKIFIAPSLRPRRLCRANIFMWFFFVKQEREKKFSMNGRWKLCFSIHTQSANWIFTFSPSQHSPDSFSWLFVIRTLLLPALLAAAWNEKHIFQKRSKKKYANEAVSYMF